MMRQLRIRIESKLVANNHQHDFYIRTEEQKVE